MFGSDRKPIGNRAAIALNGATPASKQLQSPRDLAPAVDQKSFSRPCLTALVPQSHPSPNFLAARLLSRGILSRCIEILGIARLDPALLAVLLYPHLHPGARLIGF